MEPTLSYEVDKKAAILVNMSVSLVVVSSNPGVSINVTERPSNQNGCACATSTVHDTNPLPTRRSEPLATLMNWSMLCDFKQICRIIISFTVVFPLPVAPITLEINE